MGRIRTIKPEIYADAKTGMLSDRAYRIFTGLLNFSDDYGVIEFEHHELKAKILPYCQEPAVECIARPILDELLPRALVVFFFHENRKYLLIKNFHKHQRVDRPSKPVINGWVSDKIGESITYEIYNSTLDEDSTSNQRPLSAVKESKVKESKGKEGSNTSIEPKASPIVFDADIFCFLNISESSKTLWTKAYPAVDIELELNRMAAWLKANPTKLKKRYEPFITAWLSKTQDRGGSSISGRPAANRVDEDWKAKFLAMNREKTDA